MASQSSDFLPSLESRLTPSIETLNRLKTDIFQKLRVAVPAVVVGFKIGPPATVSVVVATEEYVLKNTSTVADQLQIATVPLTLPILEDVPILIPSGGGYSFTVPIKQGDEVLLVFSDTVLDGWLQNGVNGTAFTGGETGVYPTDLRRHSLSDAVAICGLRSKPRAIANYSTMSAQLRSDDSSVVIDLAETGITIMAPDVTVNASSSATVNAPAVTLGSHTTIDSRQFLFHTHSDTQPGTGTTGGVV